MLNSRLFRLIRDQRLSVPILRCFHHEFSQPDTKKLENENVDKEKGSHEMNNMANAAAKDNHLTGAISQKYKIFREEESPEILDVNEERQRYQTQDEPDEGMYDDYMDLNLKRGLHGVFDVEDLVDVLRKESAEDIFVCSVPKDLKYIDHMVICSGRSYRHMLAMAEFVRRIYKIKRQKGDILPKIEGEKSRDWMAMDLVTNTTQMTNTITTPILRTANGLSLTPAITMKPNIFKIVPESMQQTKPQILTFNTTCSSTIAQGMTTTTINNTTIMTTQQRQQQQHPPTMVQMNKTIGTIVSSKGNHIAIANKVQKTNGNNINNTATGSATTTAPKNVVFQKEGKLYIIDPLQMKLKQQQKKQVSLLKPQVSLLKRQQNAMSPPQHQPQTSLTGAAPAATKTVTDSKLNIAFTSTIQMPTTNNAPQIHLGIKQQRNKAMNTLQLMHMKRILFEKQFLRQEFTNIQSAVEFLLRRLKLIVPKDSLLSDFPFVCHSQQEFQSLTAFKQRAYEWLRAKNISRMLRNHKDLQNLNQKSKEKFWSTKEIATFARHYAYTPIIKSLPRPGDVEDDENSKHFMDLVKSELKQEHNLQYDTLTDHQGVSKWVHKVWHTLEDHEQQEEQHQIIDIDTIQEEPQVGGRKQNSLTVQTSSISSPSSSSSCGLKPPSASDVYLPPPQQLENEYQLVSDICKDLNIKLQPEELETNVYHPSSQTVLAQCLHIFIEKLLRQSIAMKQREETPSSHSSQDSSSICNILPQDLVKVFASNIDFDFLTNNNFGSSSLGECVVTTAIKQEKS